MRQLQAGEQGSWQTLLRQKMGVKRCPLTRMKGLV